EKLKQSIETLDKKLLDAKAALEESEKISACNLVDLFKEFWPLRDAPDPELRSTMFRTQQMRDDYAKRVELVDKINDKLKESE
ncbi:unnamed protein product, partial [marine sediment metagenome]